MTLTIRSLLGQSFSLGKQQQVSQAVANALRGNSQSSSDSRIHNDNDKDNTINDDDLSSADARRDFLAGAGTVVVDNITITILPDMQGIHDDALGNQTDCE